MPKPEYPKSRRMLMQAVLCLILGASVGLAALVEHDRGLYGPHLAAARYVDRVGVRLPVGWIFAREKHGTELFVAVEPDSPDHKGRRLTVDARNVDPTVAPEEYLQSSGLLKGTLRVIPADPSANVADPITIAGMPGVMLKVQKPVGGFPFLIAPETETELVAASIRPSGLAISLKLECPDDSDSDADQQMLSSIAEEMDVQDSSGGQ